MSAVGMQADSDKHAIRAFHVSIPEEALVDLRRRISATRWPDRETVTDQSQGPQLATLQKLARYWETEYDWRKVEAQTERPAEFRDRDRWAGHPLHSRSLEARERVAAHRHARLARLGHRAAEDHRSADQSDGTWRERGGRFRSGDPVDAGLRVLGQADHDGLGPGAHRARLGRADEAPWIHEVRGTRRRLGRDHHGRDGRPGASGTARHSLQHARRVFARHRQGCPYGRSGAVRSLRGRESSRTSSWPSYTRRASATATRWGCARRRFTGLQILPSA